MKLKIDNLIIFSNPFNHPESYIKNCLCNNIIDYDYSVWLGMLTILKR